MVLSTELALNVVIPTVNLAIMVFVPIVLPIITQVAVSVLSAQMATIQLKVLAHALLFLQEVLNVLMKPQVLLAKLITPCHQASALLALMVPFQLLTQPHAHLVVMMIVKFVVKLEPLESVLFVTKLSIFLQESAHLVVTQIVPLALALELESVPLVLPVTT